MTTLVRQHMCTGCRMRAIANYGCRSLGDNLMLKRVDFRYFDRMLTELVELYAEANKHHMNEEIN